jgi:hypothetical protein
MVQINKGKYVPTSWIVTGAFLETRVYKSPSLLLFKTVFLNVGHMGSQGTTLIIYRATQEWGKLGYRSKFRVGHRNFTV